MLSGVTWTLGAFEEGEGDGGWWAKALPKGQGSRVKVQRPTNQIELRDGLLALPLPGYVTLGKSFALSKFQFPHP